MQQTVSKSQFKAQVLEYLRTIEKKKQPLIITHGGKPVIKVTPYQEKQEDILKSLRNSVISYKGADKPVGEEWHALKWFYLTRKSSSGR